MAIVTEELQPAKRGFIVNATSADASGTETLLAAVTGESHFITSITIACISAITVLIHDDTGTPVNILGPVPFATTSAPITVEFWTPIKLAAAKAIEVTASGAGAICVAIQGYTE